MYKIIAIMVAFLVMTLVAQGQETPSFQKVDSTTYSQYLTGQWDELIEVGHQAIKQNMDFKHLRQRIGYAYYAKENYVGAQKQFEKALEFDSSDSFTRNYLYFCAVKNGDEAVARLYAAKLPSESKKEYNIHGFNPINAVDAEYNYKSNNISIRTNPIFMRAGISSQLGYRLSLYQSVENYSQVVNKSTQTTQWEYYGLLSYQPTTHTAVRVAYHYISTDVNTTRFPGNMVFGALAHQLGRFNLALQGSLLSNDMGNYWQADAVAGVVLPGRSSIYLTSTLSSLTDTKKNQYIFSQSAGARIFKPLWIEGNITLGNLKNYNNYSALYVYNSLDATTFRSGIQISCFLGKHLKFIGSYSFDQKEVIDTQSKYYYNQHSFLGGFRWTL